MRLTALNTALADRGGCVASLNGTEEGTGFGFWCWWLAVPGHPGTSVFLCVEAVTGSSTVLFNRGVFDV